MCETSTIMMFSHKNHVSHIKCNKQIYSIASIILGYANVYKHLLSNNFVDLRCRRFSLQ